MWDRLRNNSFTYLDNKSELHLKKHIFCARCALPLGEGCYSIICHHLALPSCTYIHLLFHHSGESWSTSTRKGAVCLTARLHKYYQVKFPEMKKNPFSFCRNPALSVPQHSLVWFSSHCCLSALPSVFSWSGFAFYETWGGCFKQFLTLLWNLRCGICR